MRHTLVSGAICICTSGWIVNSFSIVISVECPTSRQVIRRMTLGVFPGCQDVHAPYVGVRTDWPFKNLSPGRSFSKKSFALVGNAKIAE